MDGEVGRVELRESSSAALKDKQGLIRVFLPILVKPFDDDGCIDDKPIHINDAAGLAQ